MATTIVTKYGSDAPAASDIVRGELAVDTENGRLYTENSSAAVVELGSNPSGNITFGDNGKAIFGAGSDLQIYHDGSNSYIDDAGTGSLVMRGNDAVYLQKYTGENMLAARADGAVELYHNDALKLATTATGIDVTGIATMDGLTVDKTGGNIAASFISDDSNNSYVQFQNATTGTTTYTDGSLVGIDSDESLTIWQLESNHIKFGTAATERMRIDSSGSVGIGTGTPSAVLTTQTTGALTLDSNDGDHSAFGLLVYLPTSRANTVSGAIGFSGAGGRKYAAIGAQTYADTDQTGLNFYVQPSASGSTAAMVEAMRIDLSGDLIVGGTSSGANDAVSISNTGYIQAIVNGDTVGYFNRRTSDGEILRFQKDGTSVGSLGVNATRPYIASSAMGLKIAGSEIHSTSATGVSTDATYNLGSSLFRWKDLYLSGGAASGTSSNFLRFLHDGSNGIIDNSAGSLVFRRSGFAESMRIDSSGNVGISVNPSAFVLPDGSSGALQLQSGGMVSAYAGVTHLSQNWYYNSGEKYIANGSASRLVMSGADYIWQSAGNNTSGAGAALTWSESMRLSGGTLLAGTTTVNGEGITLSGNNNYGYFSRSGDAALFVNRAGTDGDALGFRRGGAGVGSISVNGSGTFYNTSSDQRLKDKIVDAPSASDDIDAIRVRSFDWKADGSHQKYGMIAQELIEVAPEAVSATEDPDEMMGVDYSKLVPMLIKEIQQLRKRVKDLEEE